MSMDASEARRIMEVVHILEEARDGDATTRKNGVLWAEETGPRTARATSTVVSKAGEIRAASGVPARKSSGDQRNRESTPMRPRAVLADEARRVGIGDWMNATTN